MKRPVLTLLTTFLVLTPVVLFAQAPNLGACASFALFTRVGALDNTGVLTSIVGNIGTNDGAFNGYSSPTATVAGQTHNVDATSAQAAIDVQKAYDNLLGRPCPVLLLPVMGSNQILAPGTYCNGGAASMVGDLILDGQNQTNPLFIIKIHGALTSGAGARVLLTNGATANNVFWQVHGAASFAAGTAFAGTFIAYGAINFGDGASLHGRALSTEGAISTYNNQIISPGAAPLPVELAAFTARAQGSTAVTVAWSTASEKNSAHFELERSANGTAFRRIGTVTAAGNSSSPRKYLWTDETLPTQTARLYYRLRQIDVDGTCTYSPVRAVSQLLAAENQLLVYPNPAHGVVRTQVLGPLPTEPVQVLDARGRIVQTHPTLGADGILPLSGLPAGMYVLRCGSLAQRLTLE